MRFKASDQKQKPRHRKGLWSPEEDQKLRDYIMNHGHGCWSAVPIKAGLQRNGKSCRLRWINYLRPGLKRGTFSKEEEEIILTLHSQLGNKWSMIAQRLPGRTDNEIKNYWHSYLKKRFSQESEGSTKSLSQTTSSTDNTDPLPSPTSSLKTLVPNHDSTTDNTINQYSNLQINPNLPQNYCFPKLCFAEWLQEDHRPIYASNSQELMVRSYSLSELGFGGGSCNVLSNHNNNPSTDCSIFHTQELKPGNQIFGTGDDICSELMMNNDDFMYSMMEACLQ